MKVRNSRAGKETEHIMETENAGSTWWAEFATYHQPTLTVGEHHARGGVGINFRRDLIAHDVADVAGAFAQLPENWKVVGEIQEVDPNFHVVRVAPTETPRAVR
ncbi:hypothetical protein BKG61_24085 [Mycobacterium syngnathidarum]|uniref:Uncharacterized protein n=1 Tax=Mycobacterium syngnathidarum TaxID=1908205 RepID=A0A1S1JV15_9MYCO|nr:hypothetical protein BKG61_24085 [Mycobacterium syngnathidarum]